MIGLEDVFGSRCEARHFGPWLIELQWLQEAVEQIRAGILQPQAAAKAEEAELYAMTEDGVAYIPIQGALMKGKSKYGGASSLEARRALRIAGKDEAVRAAVLHIDSPGGTYAGTADLAADVRAFSREKPIVAHIDDLGASAAYWVASQADRITANSTAEVGSIGTLAVVTDSSGEAESRGIKVHVLASGPYKGTGAPGAPLTEAQIEYLQGRVDDLNAHFVRAVADGRAVPRERVETWADGRVWIAEKAKALGLIDDVGSLDSAFSYLRERMDDSRRRSFAAIDTSIASVKINLMKT